MPSIRPKNLIVLLFGTWMEPEDITPEQIEKAKEIFPHCDVIVPDWRTKTIFGNEKAKLSPWGRRAGARIVAEEVNKWADKNPAGQIYMIGFSHGGNVAFLSCRYMPKNHYPKFIGTVGTPMMGFYDDDYDRVSPETTNATYWGAWISTGDSVQWLGSIGRFLSDRRIDGSADYIKAYDNFKHRELIKADSPVWEDIKKVIHGLG